mmetsp:Transcript_45128/g.67022  ORF Transcript_45128/g.67022 Transcript_45128/m.67022 type:complete len:190 (+) Transcript_45128:104-673(+)|eukprot:CAMPEP_0194034048 /NCGR_PEP_ID=MMETSP0009_2-20130614/6465_1 /TAXON_ID=210454 /ORGANISM="Grammatophora oceanica, Strain CCMP 410" /LENGTH=189 /DNA_ID=CAMNT_0038674787 /DNA_START=76 /DNA_END=645 /DNA_ORIENTATION=+
MSLSMLAQSAGFALTGTVLETKFGPPANNNSGLFFVTPAIFSVMGFWIVSFGFTVGKARSNAIEAAKKDGEKDVEERYGLPNLYAQGTSKHVRTFNCVQRAHQHIFEQFTQAVLMGTAAAATFPITAGASSLIYFVGRYSLSTGYAAAEGDASKRYSSALAKYMWYGLVSNFFLSVASCGYQISGKKLW